MLSSTLVEDRLLGYLGQHNIQVPQKSELLIWSWAWMGPVGADYCALVEALPDARNIGVARKLAVVKKGRVPVHAHNPHPYSLSIGWFQNFGKLYYIDEADVHGPCDLSLSLEDDVTVKVGKVFAKHDEDFGRTDLVQQHIRTGDAAPIRERHRPLPPLMYKGMKTLSTGMLEKGVIRESCIPWAAPKLEILCSIQKIECCNQ